MKKRRANKGVAKTKSGKHLVPKNLSKLPPGLRAYWAKKKPKLKK